MKRRSKSRGRWLRLAAAAFCALGAAAPASAGELWHAFKNPFLVRRPEPAKACPQSCLLEFARELTKLEDEIRRNGTITLKQPDVWNDRNLLYFIQEYEAVLGRSVGVFQETLQGALARSDRAEADFAASLGSNATAPALKDITNIELGDAKSTADVLKAFKDSLPPAKTSIGVEPTEMQRQLSTFVQVNHALRRRNMGGDNTRAAGYGMYLFRMPVSVLPGRETSRGFSAVVNVRARLHIDKANLKYTFPRLALADLTDDATRTVIRDMQDGLDAEGLPLASSAAPGADRLQASTIAFGSTARRQEEQPLPPLTPQMAPATPAPAPQLRIGQGGGIGPRGVAPVPAQRDFGGPADLQFRNSLLGDVSKRIPQGAYEDVKSYLHDRFLRAYLLFEARRAFGNGEGFVDPDTGRTYIAIAAENASQGCSVAEERIKWITAAKGVCPADQPDYVLEDGWQIALGMGMLDLDLKRLLKELELKGKLSPEVVGLVPTVHFYDPESAWDETLRVWEAFVRETFPLQVFYLEPQTEEQNVYDVFSRRRELQIALAYSVAKGSVGFNQRVQLARQLGLDAATIGLNRTVVGFAHSDDTFGWYFHPRFQTPPTEATNLGAFARLLWSTGPTQAYDRRHRELEPGIRECEVIVVMPSFVGEVKFDVTTNWERITHPGSTKQSYEEMLDLGCRVEALRRKVGAEGGACDLHRAGDYERLYSRVDQLEKMLGLQTHAVNLPYKYELAGRQLFDSGTRQLKPEIHGYHGLELVDGGTDPSGHVFITGRNFDPVRTYAIIGGSASNPPGSMFTSGAKPGELLIEDKVFGGAEVVVVSRELLRVKINKLNKNLSADGSVDVRIGTPAGLSNGLRIDFYQAPKAAAATPDAVGTTPGFALANSFKVGILFDFDVQGKPKNVEAKQTAGDLALKFVGNGKERAFATGPKIAKLGVAVAVGADLKSKIYEVEDGATEASGGWAVARAKLNLAAAQASAEYLDSFAPRTTDGGLVQEDVKLKLYVQVDKDAKLTPYEVSGALPVELVRNQPCAVAAAPAAVRAAEQQPPAAPVPNPPEPAPAGSAAAGPNFLPRAFRTSAAAEEAADPAAARQTARLTSAR